ncbi:MAG: hypothetical protein JXR12_06520 [Neptunomonas phycophila]|uniref:hypothetical protein n=1 Tax=Neptunomonas phycophila TaxID=1572645 RepID=UPI003B8C331A
MILETLATTVIGEWIRSKWPKKPIQNNVENIDIISKEMPTFQTVGELRALIANFADDVPTRGGMDFPMLQVRVLDGKGQLSFGSSSAPKQSKVLRQYYEDHPAEPVKFYSWPNKTHEMLNDGSVRDVYK